MKRIANFLIYVCIFMAGTLAITCPFDYMYSYEMKVIALLAFWGLFFYYLLYVKKIVKRPLIKNIMTMSYLFIFGTITIGLLMDGPFWFLSELTPLVLFTFWGIMLYYISRKRKNSSVAAPTGEDNIPLQPVSSEREAYYRSYGLSDEDINFFRQTMNHAKQQIIRIDQNLEKSSKLRAIRNRTSVIQICQNLFKEIVNAPNRLSEVDQFLYVNLPSLENLTEKYIQIDQHQKKSRETITILDKSAQTIDSMCEAIINDYLRFMEADVEELSDEIELARRHLEKQANEDQLF